MMALYFNGAHLETLDHISLESFLSPPGPLFWSLLPSSFAKVTGLRKSG